MVYKCLEFIVVPKILYPFDRSHRNALFDNYLA